MPNVQAWTREYAGKVLGRWLHRTLGQSFETHGEAQARVGLVLARSSRRWCHRRLATALLSWATLSNPTCPRLIPLARTRTATRRLLRG